jgi:hypothetical protein
VSPARKRGPVGAVSASLARRRAKREPRVVVRAPHGELQTLAPGDGRAQPLQEAAERLISAAQSGSEG